MLIAIGVYECVKNETSFVFKPAKNNDSLEPKEHMAFKDQGFFIFSDNPLNTFTSEVQNKLTNKYSFDKLIDELKREHAGNLYFYESQKHIYMKRIDDDNHFIVLVSRSKLRPKEEGYLFVNATHAFVDPEKARVSFKNILDNPIGYTGKDCRFPAMQLELEELKAIAQRDIESLNERRELLECLDDKTISLNESSILFKERVENLNSRCCGLW